MSELLSVSSSGQDSASEMTTEAREGPLLCEVGTQVAPVRKNARIQTTQRTKTAGMIIHMGGYCRNTDFICICRYTS